MSEDQSPPADSWPCPFIPMGDDEVSPVKAGVPSSLVEEFEAFVRVLDSIGGAILRVLGFRA